MKKDKKQGYKWFAWYPVLDRSKGKKTWLKVLTKRVGSKGARYTSK